MLRLLPVAALAALLACSGDDDDRPKPTAKPAPAPADAAAPDAAAPAPAPEPLADDPFAVDTGYGAPRPMLPEEPTPGYQPTGRYRQPSARSRNIEITLRSTPPGAIAAVDGKLVGPTPTFWRGKMDGNPREFTFVLDDYALARYRFVPTTNGIVHATLEPLMDGAADAGPAE